MFKKVFLMTSVALIAAGTLVGCSNNSENTIVNIVNKNPNGHIRDEKPNIYIYPDIESDQESDLNTEPTWNTDSNRGWIEKPNVYLYPSASTPIFVSLSDPSNIICSYPEYKDGWTVTADKDGTLTDIETGKQYYALYYESASKDKIDKSTGFCIEGKKTSEFLENALTTLGLNFKERQEFIIYWLPRLEANKYNYIKFLTEDEIAMKLNVNPKPETIIRVFMAWEGLDDKINIEEQKLTPVTRDGYTVVEWGGIELKK